MKKFEIKTIKKNLKSRNCYNKNNLLKVKKKKNDQMVKI